MHPSRDRIAGRFEVAHNNHQSYLKVMGNRMFNKSASGLVVRGDEMLLVRHTYGMLKGKLLIPGGVVEDDELPMECVVREVAEEAGIVCEVKGLFCVRFRPESWWTAFFCGYISGEPVPDGRETDLAIFMNLHEAIQHPDVTDTMKVIFRSYLKNRQPTLLASDYTSANFDDSRYALFL